MNRIIALSVFTFISITQCSSTEKLASTSVYPNPLKKNLEDLFLPSLLSKEESHQYLADSGAAENVSFIGAVAGALVPIAWPAVIYNTVRGIKGKKGVNKALDKARERYHQTYEWHEGWIADAPARVILPKGIVGQKGLYECYQEIYHNMVDITESINADAAENVLPGFATEHKHFSVRPIRKAFDIGVVTLENGVDIMMDEMIKILGKKREYASVLSSDATHAIVNLSETYTHGEYKNMLCTHYGSNDGIVIMGNYNKDTIPTLNPIAPLRLAVLTSQLMRLSSKKETKDIYVETLPKLSALALKDIPLFLSLAAIGKKDIYKAFPERKESVSRVEWDNKDFVATDGAIDFVKAAYLAMNLTLPVDIEKTPKKYLNSLRANIKMGLDEWRQGRLQSGMKQETVDQKVFEFNQQIETSIASNDIVAFNKAAFALGN